MSQYSKKSGLDPSAGRTQELPPGVLETDTVEVRSLTGGDLDAIVGIDREWTGRSRRSYYELKLDEAERDTGVRISLVARIDGEVAGFLLGRLYYGEFGRPEPAAILDSIGVGKAFLGRNVGAALMGQLRMNLSALGIERIETQVDWDQLDLLRFFKNEGFRPAPSLCLTCSVSHAGTREATSSATR